SRSEAGGKSHALRAEPIGPDPGRELRGKVRDEEGGRQPSDDRQGGVVIRGERVGNRADARDVPGEEAADRETRGDRGPARATGGSRSRGNHAERASSGAPPRALW